MAEQPAGAATSAGAEASERNVTRTIQAAQDRPASHYTLVGNIRPRAEQVGEVADFATRGELCDGQYYSDRDHSIWPAVRDPELAGAGSQT